MFSKFQIKMTYAQPERLIDESTGKAWVRSPQAVRLGSSPLGNFYRDPQSTVRPARAYEWNCWWEDVESPVPLSKVKWLVEGAAVRRKPDWNERLREVSL